MKIQIVNPETGLPLNNHDNELIDENGSKFPIIDGIPIFVDSNNYADSFGFQWERFAKTQLEFGKELLNVGHDLSEQVIIVHEH